MTVRWQSSTGCSLIAEQCAVVIAPAAIEFRPGYPRRELRCEAVIGIDDGAASGYLMDGRCCDMAILGKDDQQEQQQDRYE
ncbi:MAG: hypothetical protein ACLUQK_07000 [Clostridium sp.]